MGSEKKVDREGEAVAAPPIKDAPGLVRFVCARCDVDVHTPADNARVLGSLHAELHAGAP